MLRQRGSKSSYCLSEDQELPRCIAMAPKAGTGIWLKLPRRDRRGFNRGRLLSTQATPASLARYLEEVPQVGWPADQDRML